MNYDLNDTECMLIDITELPLDMKSDLTGLEITACAADDAAIGDLEAELRMKRDVRDDRYVALNDKRSKVGMGVAGNPDFGNDSPLYGAMGFVRKSEKKSGLTRKIKAPNS